MSDQELLESAAKAAGMTGMRWSGLLGLVRMLGQNRPKTTGSVGPYWNPLTDDGDALRLAVRLRIDIDSTNNLVQASHGVSAGFREPLGTDPYAATRRAIVRAAAAMEAVNV